MPVPGIGLSNSGANHRGEAVITCNTVKMVETRPTIEGGKT